MRSGRPACRCRGVTVALYYLVCSNRFSVKAGPRSIKKHARDAMAFRE